MKKFLFFAIASSFLLGSCSKEYDESILPSKPSETRSISEEDVDYFTLNISYKEKNYVVPCKSIQDSIVFLDKEFADIYDLEIGNNPNVVTNVKEDGTIEYLENPRSFEKKYKLSLIPKTQARTITLPSGMEIGVGRLPIAATDTAGYVILFDDKKYEDRHVQLNCRIDGWSEHCINFETVDKFNDKASSLKLINKTKPTTTYKFEYKNEFGGSTFEYRLGSECRVCFIGYEDKNLQKAQLVCWAKAGAEHTDIDLKKIPISKHRNWNDKISSATVTFAPAHSLPNSHHDDK